MPAQDESVSDALDDVIIDKSAEGPGNVARVTHPVDALIWVESGKDLVQMTRRSPRGTWYPVRRESTFDDIVDWLTSFDKPVEIEHGPDRDELPPTK